uniref:Putative secreted protein n=1 Tax=Anopheles marajoara TaxID=58244 RepID=A0A2M4C612_9DIPT
MSMLLLLLFVVFGPCSGMGHAITQHSTREREVTRRRTEHKHTHAHTQRPQTAVSSSSRRKSVVWSSQKSSLYYSEKGRYARRPLDAVISRCFSPTNHTNRATHTTVEQSEREGTRTLVNTTHSRTSCCCCCWCVPGARSPSPFLMLAYCAALSGSPSFCTRAKHDHAPA